MNCPDCGRSMRAGVTQFPCLACRKAAIRRNAVRCRRCGSQMRGTVKWDICTQNEECKAISQAERRKRWNASVANTPERKARYKRNASIRERRKRVESNPMLIAEDGIVDPVAIYVAINGLRPVRLTMTERKIAAHERAVMRERGEYYSDSYLRAMPVQAEPDQ